MEATTIVNRRSKEMKNANKMDEQNKQLEADMVEYEPRVKSRVGRVLIWIGVAFFICFAVGTRSVALTVIAVLALGISGIFTARSRVKKKPEK